MKYFVTEASNQTGWVRTCWPALVELSAVGSLPVELLEDPSPLILLLLSFQALRWRVRCWRRSSRRHRFPLSLFKKLLERGKKRWDLGFRSKPSLLTAEDWIQRERAKAKTRIERERSRDRMLGFENPRFAEEEEELGGSSNPNRLHPRPGPVFLPVTRKPVELKIVYIFWVFF